MGGVGKTEIALKFAETKRDWFWAIFMVDARSQRSIAKSFRDIAPKLDPISVADTDEKAMKIVKDWLVALPKERDWLLIFDGANDPEIRIEDYFPSGGRGAILVTSTSPALSRVSGSYESVGGLDPESASELLLSKLWEKAPQQIHRLKAREICQKLEGLPLAILHAGSLVRNGDCTLNSFLDKVQTYQQRWLKAERDTQTRWIYGTWNTCRTMIQERKTKISIDALDILTVCCLVDHKSIPFKLFRRMPRSLQGDRGLFGNLSMTISTFGTNASRTQDRALWDHDRIRQAVILLADYSLALYDGESSQFSIHRLVHEWLCLDLKTSGGDRLRRWAKSAATVGLTENIDPMQRSPEIQAERFKLLPHVASFREQDVLPFKLSQIVDALAEERFAFLYFDSGNYDKAEELFGRCVSAFQNSRDVGDRRYLRALVGLAEVLERKALFVKALATSQEAKHGWMQADPKSNMLVRCRQILALSLKGLNQLTAAKEELLSLLEEPHPNSEPPDEIMLETVAILAEVHRREGDFISAIKRSEQNYANRKELLGFEHQDTLESARSLAMTLLHHGSRLGDATEIMERVCKSRETILGTHHPDTILSLSSLSKLLKNQGNYERAEEEQVKALNSITKVVGHRHPNALSMMNSLGDLCMQKERFTEAEAWFRAAYDGYLNNENIGPGHSYTLTAKTNVALSLQNGGKLGEADAIYNEVMEECMKNGKEKGVEALHCMISQSDLCTMRQDFRAAEALARRVAIECQAVHGEKSPAYFTALIKISRAVQSERRYAEAEQLLRTARDGLADVCGTGNPRTLDALALLAHVVSRQDRCEEALPMYQAASDGWKALGDDGHWCHQRLEGMLNMQPHKQIEAS